MWPHVAVHILTGWRAAGPITRLSPELHSIQSLQQSAAGRVRARPAEI